MSSTAISVDPELQASTPFAGSSGVPSPHTYHLIHALLWPAVAGNVAWALCSTTLNHSQTVSARLPVALIEVELLVYLTVCWVSNEAQQARERYHWLGDTAHLLTVALFAISAERCSDHLHYLLFAFYAVVVVCNWTGIWGRTLQSRQDRIGMVVVGMMVLGLMCFIPAFPYPWDVAGSLGVVLAIWLCLRFG